MKTLDSDLFTLGIFRLLGDTEGGIAALHYDGPHNSSTKATYISYFSGLVTKTFDRNEGEQKVILTHSYSASSQTRDGGIPGIKDMMNQEVETKIRTRSGYLLQRPVLSDPLLSFRPHLLNNNCFWGGYSRFMLR